MIAALVVLVTFIACVSVDFMDWGKANAHGPDYIPEDLQ